MRLDIFTLLFVIATACLFACLAFVFAWWRSRSEPVLAPTVMAFALGAIGAFLLVARGNIPDFLSIDIANAAIFAAMAFGWNAFKAMNGRRQLLWPAIASGLLWLGLCRVPAFYDEMAYRVAVCSIIIALLSLGGFVEFWKSPKILKPIRRLLLAATGCNVLVYVVRAIYTLETGRPSSILENDPLMAAALFLPLFFIVALALGGLWLWQSRTVGILQHEMERDPLTGILNRRAFEKGAASALTSMAQARETLALLLIDIDHFKQVNDRFGHLAGDHVLRLFTKTVAEELRKSDLFARYGGEEFVVLLRGADLHDALQVAEKLRERIADLVMNWQESKITVTASIGVASTQAASVSLFELLDRADRGLYGAKGGGRNRVVIAAPA